MSSNNAIVRGLELFIFILRSNINRGYYFWHSVERKYNLIFAIYTN